MFRSLVDAGELRALKNLFEISPRLDGDKFFTEAPLTFIPKHMLV